VERPASEADIQQQLASLLSGLNLDFRVVALGALICVATFILGFYRIATSEKAVTEVKMARPQVAMVSADAAEEELNDIDAAYKKKIRELNGVVNNQFYLTKVLSALPHLMPERLWLNSVDINKDNKKIELVIRGTVYSGDNDKDIGIVNKLVANLKIDPDFSAIFKEIDIEALTQNKAGDVPVVDFSITCRTAE